MTDQGGGPSFSDLVEAVSGGLARFSLDIERAETVLVELGDAPYVDLRSAVSKLAASAPWPVAAALLRLARRLGDTDPRRAKQMARLALGAVLRARLPERFTGSLRAEAESLIGDALRRLGKRREAARAFTLAARHLQYVGDPYQSALYYSRLSLLRWDQGRHDEASALLERAASLFAEVGQTDDQAQALLDRATRSLARNEVDAAMVDLREAIFLADKGLRPDLAAMSVAAYCTILCDLRRRAEALAVLRGFRERYPGFDAPPLLLAELDLLEGGLLIFSDRPDVAEARLNAARREFFLQGHDREAALASLSLALLYLLNGRRGPDLRQLAETSIEPLSRSRNLPSAICTSLSQFSAAVEDGTANAAHAGALREHVATLPTPTEGKTR